MGIRVRSQGKVVLKDVQGNLRSYEKKAGRDIVDRAEDIG